MMDGTFIDPSPERRADHRQRKALWREWRRFGDDFEAAFDFFQAHQTALLQLISSNEFLKTL